ncbi:hypothetical protein Fmac_027881 [Flemingia macrophylla]|uniref:DUF4378 domain-containing protein n=1 Tax=Flemingia macrophylla TaxID=520843 RepID=A0ABD1LIY5_9FABA
MTTGMVRDQNLEKHIHKQMGCMAGFLQIFDRNQILTGKRAYTPKRLPPATPEKPAGASPPAPPEPKPSLPVLEFKEGTRSSWKFSREAPRLSLDSRATVDAKGSLQRREIPENEVEKQRRSTSVIAKLMGLEPLPDGPVPKLQRSASESRVSRDLPVPVPAQYHNSFPSPQSQGNNDASFRTRLPADPPRHRHRHRHRDRLKKSFYDSADFFPEPKQSVSVYGEIERRLRMRGINEPSKDLHTLKHILEALQLKGLLHSNQSPIVLMKPLRPPPPPPVQTRSTPRRRPEIDRNVRPPSSSPNRRQRKVSLSASVSPVHSPKVSPRRNAYSPSGSPRLRKNIERKEKALREDESSTVSDNDTERYRMEDYKEGKDLLDRCDKLLNSIAEITELQPSPVSVLDSSFYKDEWCSPSPITKRCIDYKDQAAESEDDVWSWEAASEDCDFVYVSEILRACSYLPEESDVFVVLEKQQCLKGKDTSKASRLQRRLIFDTLQEILSRNEQLPPWKAAVWCGEQRQRIWSEFQRIREREESESEDLFKVICGVLRKDMAEEMRGWPVEMGDVVLDIERLVFKDLVGETIRELASHSQSNNPKLLLRRKLLF